MAFKLDVPKRWFNRATELCAHLFQTPTGGRQTFGLIESRFQVTAPVQFPSYTVAEAQALAEETLDGTVIFVSDETGGPCLAISNGTNFLTCHANVAIST